MYKIIVLVLTLWIANVVGQESLRVTKEARVVGVCNTSRGGCGCSLDATHIAELTNGTAADLTAICIPQGNQCNCACAGTVTGTIYDQETCPFSCRALRVNGIVGIDETGTALCATSSSTPPPPREESTPAPISLGISEQLTGVATAGAMICAVFLNML